MKKLQNGFTLAEALITMAIIGVIASLTLPALQVNLQKQQASSALAKAINTLETANKLALEENHARTLNQLSEQNYFDDVLGDYVGWQVASLGKKYTEYANTTEYSTGAENMHTTKDGITFLHKPEAPTSLEEEKLKELGLGYGGSYYTVYIDTNGNNKGPNALGKDLFYVAVDTKGSVIPYGGADWKAYSGEDIMWTGDGCGNPKINPTQPLSCSGSIADNGFKVIY